MPQLFEPVLALTSSPAEHSDTDCKHQIANNSKVNVMINENEECTNGNMNANGENSASSIGDVDSIIVDAGLSVVTSVLAHPQGIVYSTWQPTLYIHFF